MKHPPSKKGDQRWVKERFSSMLKYNPQLKTRARSLRTNLTDAEQRLWSRLRRKQILGVQFYRQKPIGNYIVDFYAPTVQLIIELDGSHHFDLAQARRDKQRTEFLEQQGLMVLRFDDRQVLTETQSVVEEIFRSVREKKIPPNLPFTKGGT
jgi:very-short-patch-repair endonuclease